MPCICVCVVVDDWLACKFALLFLFPCTHHHGLICSSEPSIFRSVSIMYQSHFFTFRCHISPHHFATLLYWQQSILMQHFVSAQKEMHLWFCTHFSPFHTFASCHFKLCIFWFIFYFCIFYITLQRVVIFGEEVCEWKWMWVKRMMMMLLKTVTVQRNKKVKKALALNKTKIKTLDSKKRGKGKNYRKE